MIIGDRQIRVKSTLQKGIKTFVTTRDHSGTASNALGVGKFCKWLSQWYLNRFCPAFIHLIYSVCHFDLSKVRGAGLAPIWLWVWGWELENSVKSLQKRSVTKQQ